MATSLSTAFRVTLFLLAVCGCADATKLNAAPFLSRLTLGVDYYPEAWDPSVWSTDAAAMAAAGISMVRVAEFAWHSFQPTEGAPYNFTWLDAALDVLVAHGIRAVVGTPTASPPSYMASADPTLQLVDEHGAPIRYGTRQNVNHLHEGYRAATRAIVGAIGTHYAGDARVAAFQVTVAAGVARACALVSSTCAAPRAPPLQIDNELQAQEDFSGLTAAAFQAWLGAKYNGSLAAINAA